MSYYNKMIKRFWSKVNIRGPDDCWEWKGSLNNYGYGQFKLYRAVKLTHRISWSLTNGIIPRNMLILHRCDNRKCVNPNHLYCGTQADNIRDKNTRNPVSPAISGQSLTKLCHDEILTIRHLRGKSSGKYIGEMFGVGHKTIYRVWKSTHFLCKEGYYV